MSVYVTVFAGSTPVGGLLMGWIASEFGVDVSLAAGGIACVAIGVVGLAWLRSSGGRAATTTELGADEPAGPGVATPAGAAAPGATDAGRLSPAGHEPEPAASAATPRS
jgi:hypothetical protein